MLMSAAQPGPAASFRNMQVDYRAVTSPMIEQLQRCLERILELEHIGPQDNFFELGGDSLAAAQLMVKIEERFGLKVPGAILLQHPTCAALAVAIEQGADEHLKADVVPVNESGSLPPIFVTHMQDGSLWVAQNLSQHLSGNKPVFGIRPDTGKWDFGNLRELAEQNVKALLTQHPRQDYELIGYCFGALLAYEMARQLQAGGYRVSFLGIMDIRPDIRKRSVRLKDRIRRDGMLPSTRWFARWLSDWYRFRRTRSSVAEILWHPIASARYRLGRLSTQSRPVPPPVGASPSRESAFARKTKIALSNHVPGTYSGDITLFVTRTNSMFRDFEMRAAWRELTSGNVEVIPVEGEQGTIAQNPHIQQIAARLIS